MVLGDWLTTGQVRAIFAEEVFGVGGSIREAFDDGTLLFARGVLPQMREVRPRDQLHSGVAMRCMPEQVVVHPYVFREVCRNGAIMAWSQQSHQIEISDYHSPESELREAIQECCQEEAFVACFEGMQATLNRPADLSLSLLPFLDRMPKQMAQRLLQQITDRFDESADRTAFSLMNAVTSIARDTRDQQTRWRLEELGGGVAALVEPEPKPDRSGAVISVGE